VQTGNTHLKQALKSIWLKLILLCIAMFVFQLLFAVLGTSSDIQKSMQRDLADVPKFAQKMMGEGFVEALMTYGTLTIGYLHPFTMLLLIVYIFMAVTQMVVGEISSGTIGFTLSKPISRQRIFINLAIVVYSGLILLSLAAYAATVLGIVFLYPKNLSAAPFWSLVLNLILIMFFVAGYIVVLAAVSESGKKMYTYGGITLFFMYLLSFAAPLWKPLETIVPISPFHYYKPLDILMGRRLNTTVGIMIFLVSAVLFGIAAYIFKRRDIAAG